MHLFPAAYCQLGALFAKSLGNSQANSGCGRSDDHALALESFAVVRHVLVGLSVDSYHLTFPTFTAYTHRQ